MFTFLKLNIPNMKVDEKASIMNKFKQLIKLTKNIIIFANFFIKKNFFNQIQLNQCLIKDKVLFNYKLLQVFNN